MKEKIKDLVIECYNPYSNFDHEKFAMLVIKDVLDILADSKNFNKCVYTTFDSAQGNCVASELAKKIKEHFGVEE